MSQDENVARILRDVWCIADELNDTYRSDIRPYFPVKRFSTALEDLTRLEAEYRAAYPRHFEHTPDPGSIKGLDISKESLTRWLANSQATLWGRSFNVVDNPEEAAHWLQEQILEYIIFTVKDEE